MSPVMTVVPISLRSLRMRRIESIRWPVLTDVEAKHKVLVDVLELGDEVFVDVERVDRGDLVDEVCALELLVLEVVVVIVTVVAFFDQARDLGLAGYVVDADCELAVRFSIQPGDEEVSLALSYDLRAFDLTYIAFVGGGRPERVALPNGAQENQEAKSDGRGPKCLS